MKAVTKSELAQMAGVSMGPLSAWIKSIEGDLKAMGYRRNMKLLPPRIAKHIMDHFCIERDR